MVSGPSINLPASMFADAASIKLLNELRPAMYKLDSKNADKQNFSMALRKMERGEILTPEEKKSISELHARYVKPESSKIAEGARKEIKDDPKRIIKVVDKKEETKTVVAQKTEPERLATVSFIGEGTAVTNINIPKGVQNSPSQKDKDAVNAFKADVNKANEAYNDSLKGIGGAGTTLQSLELAKNKLADQGNNFSDDIEDAQRMDPNKDLEYVKNKLLKKYDELLKPEEKTKISAMTSLNDLINVETKTIDGKEVIVPTGKGIAIDIAGRIKKDIGALDTQIATAKSDFDKAKNITPAKQKLEADVKAAEDKFLQSISQSTDPYVRDVVRALKNDGGVVTFMDEKLRTSKYEIQDGLVDVLKSASLSPEVAKGFNDRQVIADAVIKKLSKEQQELAKMANLIATKDEKGNPVVDKDTSMLENLMVGFDRSTGSDRDFFSKAKLFDPATMKALVGFMRYGFTDKDGNKISSGDKAKLAERWGLAGMDKKEIDRVFRSLYGSINERLDYRGLNDLKDPRKSAAVFGTINRALNDRTDRVSEFHQKLFQAFDITKWNTTDFALMALSLGLGAKPLEAVVAGAARHDKTGILSIVSLGMAVIRTTNKERRGIGQGSGNGNGNQQD